METNSPTTSLSAVLVSLYRGVLYQDQKPELWQALLKLENRVRDHAAQLGYAVSLLIALLRKKLAEHDAGGGDSRLILSREQIVDFMRVFVADSSNEAKLVDRIDTDINRVVELGFLRPLRGQDNQYELRRIIKTFVDAQWLSELTQRLDEYRVHLDEDHG